MTFITKTAQRIVNEALDQHPLQDSYQDAVCKLLGKAPPYDSVQRVLNDLKTQRSTSETEQRMVFENLQVALSLSGPPSKYTVQKLLNMAEAEGINPICGLTTLNNYIKSLSGLYIYYPLDETSGNAINHAPATLGTLPGTVSGATQGATGKIGNAYSFDGSNDSVSPGDLDEFNNSDGMAFVVMGKFDAAATKGLMGFRNGDTDDSFYLFGLSNTSVEGRFRDSAGTASTIAATVTDLTSDWSMLGLSLLNGTLSIYQNGSVVGTPITGITGSFGTGDHTFTIGNEGGAVFYADGLMQHGALFNRGLTGTEMLRLAQVARVAA